MCAGSRLRVEPSRHRRWASSSGDCRGPLNGWRCPDRRPYRGRTRCASSPWPIPVLLMLARRLATCGGSRASRSRRWSPAWSSAPSGWWRSPSCPPSSGRRSTRGSPPTTSRRALVLGLVLLWSGLLQAAAGIIRHRFAVPDWLVGAYRTVQVGGPARGAARGHPAHAGRDRRGGLDRVLRPRPRRQHDRTWLAGPPAPSSRSSSSRSILLQHVGDARAGRAGRRIALLLLASGRSSGRCRSRNLAQREMMGELNTLAADIVGGLRVLRGIGGEEVFHRPLRPGVPAGTPGRRQVARLQSLLDSLQVLLPGLFVVVVVWIGARFAVEGQMQPGELVAFYGFSAFLMMPLRTATEVANKLIRGLVAGTADLSASSAVEPEVVDIERPVAEPRPVDGGQTWSTCRPGTSSSLARSPPVVRGGGRPARTVRGGQGHPGRRPLDRLGRFAEGPVLLDGVSLSVWTVTFVRRWILVSDSGSIMFSGVLSEELDPRGTGDGAALAAALHASSAEDVVDALPEGLSADVEERGRSFSGRAAPAARSGPRAGRRPRHPRARRPHVGGRRPHRVHHRRAAASPPERAYHRRHHHQPAAARPGGPGRVPRGRRGGVRRHAPAAAGNGPALPAGRDPGGGRDERDPAGRRQRNGPALCAYAQPPPPPRALAGDLAACARGGRRAGHAMAARQPGGVGADRHHHGNRGQGRRGDRGIPAAADGADPLRPLRVVRAR